MFAWIKNLKKAARPALILGTRRSEDTVAVEIKDFAPTVTDFLGLVAYFELALYEISTQAVIGAPSLQAKQILAEVAGEALTKHHAFVDELRGRHLEPFEIMEKFSRGTDRYRQLVKNDDWHQQVLTIWLISGLFESFYVELAAGVDDKYKQTAITVLSDKVAQDRLQDLLATEIATVPERADVLALWGRRLVGDTLLAAMWIMKSSAGQEFDETKMDPVFTELTSGHMLRMDSLGLTA